MSWEPQFVLSLTMENMLDEPVGDFDWGPNRPWRRLRHARSLHLVLAALGSVLLTIGIVTAMIS